MVEAAKEHQYDELKNLSKKPLFNFLQTEIVKQFKLSLLKPPKASAQRGGHKAQATTEEAKNKNLDNLLL